MFSRDSSLPPFFIIPILAYERWSEVLQQIGWYYGPKSSYLYIAGG